MSGRFAAMRARLAQQVLAEAVVLADQVGPT
jgi:hypothetical protein